VRAQRTDQQMHEVVAHYRLRGRLRPFSRCLECNAPLRPAAADEIAARLPPMIAATRQVFVLCTGCGRVYWQGSHWRRLRALVDLVADGSDG
jgi:uncharacterized protein